MLTQQKFKKILRTSNPNISKTVCHSIINNTIFWKCIIKPIRCIYVILLNSFRFLAEVSTKLHKMHFLDNLRTIIQEGNMETRQMTPFLSSTFSDLAVYNIRFQIWKYSKFIFKWSPLWSILVCKITLFWPKATNSDNSSYLPRK